MTSPTTRLSKLSLESMPPTTRSQSHQQSSDTGRGNHDSERGDEDYDGPVRSPTTNLFYNLDNLDEETEEVIRELFRQPAQEETPQIVLEWCGFSNDPDIYAFQLQEVVPRTIRIGSPTSRIPQPRCNCMEEDSRPCRHVIWLMDQLAKQTVLDHDPDEELDMDGQGFPKQLGSPHARISDLHIDVLADSLHCDFGPSEEYSEPNPHRVREVREILAAIAGTAYEDSVDEYRPDLFDTPPLIRSDDILTRGELEYTLLRLLLSNNEFFALFLKLLAPHDKVRDPYRKLQQRVERVLASLNAYSSSFAHPAAATAAAAGTAGDSEGPRNVAWAARHILAVVGHIEMLLVRGQPPAAWERTSAARALVWILKTVVLEHNRDAHPGASQDDRNLYQRLVGNPREGPAFVVDALRFLPDQNQYIDELEYVRDAVQVAGYQEGFMRKLEDLIRKLRRRSSMGAGAKAAGEGKAGGGGGGGSGSGSGGSAGAGAAAGSSKAGGGSAGSKRQTPGNGGRQERGAKRVR